jgi:hypothetical protein
MRRVFKVFLVYFGEKKTNSVLAYRDRVTRF